MAKATKLKDGTTAKEILDAANAAYPDQLLESYYDSNGKRTKGEGDTLAEYIVIEITESIADAVDDKWGTPEALDLAIQRLEAGQEDTSRVIGALYAMRERLR